MSPELSFIIVNWNGGELLRRALESVALHAPALSYEVIVIDNASTDGSVDWLCSPQARAQFGDEGLRVVVNQENVGFGRANNQAFALTESPLLFLLNADAELRPGACERLIATLQTDARIGACGPRLLNPDGSLQTSVWRNPPAAWATLLSGLQLYRLLPKRWSGELLLADHWAHDRRRDVNMLSGAAILARREMVEDVGGFDERFHMYGEDNEWCLRIVRAGWRLVFEPEATVMHHGGQSSRRRWTDLEKLRVQLDAFFHFQRYCLPRRHAAANLFAASLLLAMQGAWRKVRGRPAEDVRLTLSLYLRDLKRTLWERRPREARPEPWSPTARRSGISKEV